MKHPPVLKYRVNAVGEPVVERPRRTELRPSSPARERYKAARRARRHPEAVMHAAAVRARTAAPLVDSPDGPAPETETL